MKRASLVALALLLVGCGSKSSGENPAGNTTGAGGNEASAGGSTAGGAGGSTSPGAGGSSIAGAGGTDSAGGQSALGGAGGTDSAGGQSGAGGGAAEDLDMQASDFECLKNWTQIRHFRLINKLGHMDEALAVAASDTGGVYPVGTVVQLIPGEAMVKRRVGFSADTGDWEFFTLKASASGTQITKRGTADLTNALGGNCLGCHSKAEPQWDRICEQTHGCDPLPFSAAQIQMIQDGDPRCH